MGCFCWQKTSNVGLIHATSWVYDSCEKSLCMWLLVSDDPVVCTRCCVQYSIFPHFICKSIQTPLFEQAQTFLVITTYPLAMWFDLKRAWRLGKGKQPPHLEVEKWKLQSVDDALHPECVICQWWPGVIKVPWKSQGERCKSLGSKPTWTALAQTTGLSSCKPSLKGSSLSVF